MIAITAPGIATVRVMNDLNVLRSSTIIAAAATIIAATTAAAAATIIAATTAAAASCLFDYPINEVL